MKLNSVSTFYCGINSKLSCDHPNIQLELTTDYAFADIVKERYDIGIRLGNHVDEDMIAVQVSDEMQMITVASPDYLKAYGVPQTSKELHQLRCIGMGLPTHEQIMAWEFKDLEKIMK